MPRLGRLAALAAGAAAYSLYEPFRYRLESKVVPLARPVPDLTILHVSDLHMNARDRRLMRFLEWLPDAIGPLPDLVVATGDLIEGDDGIDPAIASLSRLDARLGRFYVLGSHDYYLSGGPSYSKYFTGARGRTSARRADTKRLEAGLQDKGWISLTNRTEAVETERGTIRLSGVDDPYLDRERTDHIDTSAGDLLALGVVHTPDVVSEWILHGFEVVLAGHTHGGQVRLPGSGAVVTNCTLPSGLASGLHRVGSGWLHVSRGLGTGRFTPIRFACTPEASLLHLTGVTE